jgi:ATP-dependent helicase/nuclease subunit A
VSAAPHNRNLIVVAGAGTGKTYTLVQECLARLEEGVSIDEMLVVTFTKAAAAELRHRIAEALQGKFSRDPNSAHLARQIALLDRAQISTLHSFCLELVSRHFSELGLSPRLITLETAQAAVLRHETLDSLFETYYEAKNERTKAVRNMLIEWFRGDDREAREIVSRLHEFTQTRPNPQQWFETQRALLASRDPEHWRRGYVRATDDWVARWRPLVESQPPAGNPARGKILALMDKLNLAEIAALFKAGREVWPIGSKQVYRDPIKKMFDEAATLACWVVTPNSDPLLEDWNLTRETTLLLLDVAEEFGRGFAEVKRQRGLVDFHDLEQFSLRLLWNDDQTEVKPAALYWRERFKCVFVDEYQDINQAQDRIIQALAREDAAGNRFLVGDVKQSIYAFRQADPSIFLDYRNKWDRGNGGQCRFLTRNWRSHERVLDFVNNLFAGVMTEGVGEVRYDENTRLLFADEPERARLSAKNDDAPKVEIHLVRPEADEVEASEADDLECLDAFAELNAAEKQAEVIAQLCLEMVEENPLTLPTGHTATYGDIVILLRSPAAEAEVFAKVFSKRGIAFDARRTGFFNCIEALDLTNLLTILDNPLQDIELLGVLRSPIGCFSLEDLAEIRMGRPGLFWEAFQRFSIEGKGEAAAKAKDFLAKFKRWRALSRHTSLAERLEIILEETGYEDWAAAQDRGAQRRANVRRLIELARQFDDARGEGLYPFLQFVEDQANAVGDLAPATVESHGAVRLLSVHQSKGLEFPIVIMAGLHKKFNRQDVNGLSLLDDEHGLCLKARPPGKRRQYETLGFWMARQRQEKKRLHEEMRILYVGLTRAEHRLLLVGAPSKSAVREWMNGGKRPEAALSTLDWIGPWLTKTTPLWLEPARGTSADWTWRWHLSLTKQNAAPVARIEEAPSPEAMAQLKERLEWKYPFAPATEQEAKSSATALRRALPDEPELARPLVRAANSPRNKIAANQAGQATHRFLQHAQFASLTARASLDQELERLRGVNILTADEAAAIDAERICAFWQSDFGRELLQRSDLLQRELAFTAKFSRADLQKVGAPLKANFADDEFIVVQGAADLVAILEKELWLIDFKTDRVPAEMLVARMKEYSLQLRIYALALGRIYRRPVTRACLHFLEIGRTEWVPIDGNGVGGEEARADARPPNPPTAVAQSPSPAGAKQLTLF